MQRKLRSISLPIIVGGITAALSVALLVAWILLFVRSVATFPTWIAVLGITTFLVITAAIVILTVYLAREILEGQRQTRFIDSVTHELKSPLASLRLCTETLARPNLSKHQRESLREMMLVDVDRLTAFIDDILEASRLAQDHKGASAKDIDLRKLVEHCVQLLNRRFRGDDYHVDIDIADDLHFTSDPTALQVIVRNLLDNAIKYSNPPAHVTVRARVADTTLEIQVADQGIGIPPHDLRRVFKRFYRSTSEESVRARSGTGLGLYVVSALVRSLKGRVEAHSEGLDQGTTMSVQLPFRPAASTRAHASAHTTLSHPNKALR